MTCMWLLSQHTGGASLSVSFAQSIEPAFIRTRLSLALASASSGDVSRCSSNTALAASSLSSFSRISDSIITPYSPSAVALLMLRIASFEFPSPAARIRAWRSHAGPLSSSISMAFVIASCAAPASPSRISFAALSTSRGESVGSKVDMSPEILDSLALNAISDSLAELSVSSSGWPKAISLVLFLSYLSSSEPTRIAACSARASKSSGEVINSLSRVLSRVSKSPDSL